MSTIKATNTKELRKNFKKYADDISKYDETVIVTRPNNRNIVMISEEEYNSWQETNYLLETKENRYTLRQSLDELDQEKNNKVLTPEEFKTMSETDE